MKMKTLMDSTIKISGCPNSCGQHGIATIGFNGGGSKLGKNMYPIYQMSLGGRFDGETMLGINCLRIPKTSNSHNSKNNRTIQTK